MLIAIAIALILVLVTFAIHYRALTWLASISRASAGPNDRKPWSVLMIVFALFWVHMAEIAIYALAYHLSISHLEIGSLVGVASETPMVIFYYSGVVYTSLGFGDIYPAGHIRFITQVEALNGLMLITWSASFTYLQMKSIWEFDQS